MSKPRKLEIFAPKGVRLTNVRSTAHDEIVIVHDVPVEEMCLGDMPSIEVDLGDEREGDDGDG